jgi:uncharacterized protein YbjT (DUF2867 family)
MFGKKIAQNYAAGLAENKVPRAVLLSSVAAQLPSGTGPIVTAHNAKQILGKVAGTRLTSVRAAYFMENILANAHAIKDGVLPVFGGGESYPFPMIATVVRSKPPRFPSISSSRRTRSSCSATTLRRSSAR